MELIEAMLAQQSRQRRKHERHPEHVPVAELPPAWRAKLAQAADTLVTVRIEEEAAQATASATEFVTDDPAFGIWRDHEDVADVQSYVRQLRAPRYGRDGSRKDPS